MLSGHGIGLGSAPNCLVQQVVLDVDVGEGEVVQQDLQVRLSARRNQGTLLLRRWYEIMALYYVKSNLTEISASRQDRRVLQKSKIIRIEFLSKWGMLQTSRYV